MSRRIAAIAVVVALAFSLSTAEAQLLVPVGPGFGAYSGFGPYGGRHWGYGGYGGFGGYGGLYNGYGPYGGWGGIGGYGPLLYSQQLFQQQALVNQQIFQQQQQTLVSQVQVAQGRLAQLDGIKQQLFQQYQAMSDSDKAAARASLMAEYFKLDASRKEGWKRDSAIQAILGKDLPRLDGVAQIGDMSEPDRIRYRAAMLEKYRSLPPAEQKTWQNDEVIGIVMGRDWWLR